MTALRTKTFAAGELVVTDALHAAVATVAAPSTLLAADLVNSGVLDLPRSIVIARSDNAAAFSVEPYVVTGLRGGQTVVEEITPENADGNDELYGTQLFDRIVSIDIPEMGSTDGEHEFGVADIGAPKGQTFSAVELLADGNLHVQYGEPSGPRDVIPVVVAVRPYREIRPTRIVTRDDGDNETSAGVVVYLDEV